MRRVLTILACVAMLVAATAAPTAAAGPASRGTARLHVTVDTLDCYKGADGNLWCIEIETVVLTGDIIGTQTNTITFVAHKNGTVEGRGTSVCPVCTIGGRTGTETSTIVWRGVGTTIKGSSTVVGAVGDGLEGLHAQGTFVGDSGTGDYSFVFSYVFTE